MVRAVELSLSMLIDPFRQLADRDDRCEQKCLRIHGPDLVPYDQFH